MSDQPGTVAGMNASLTGGAKKARKSAAKKKPVAKKSSAKKGGAIGDDVKNLAIPFALSLLSKNWQAAEAHKKPKKQSGGGDGEANAANAANAFPYPEEDLEPTPQLEGGAKKKKKSAAKKPVKKASPAAKKTSAKNMKKIKAEFMDITQAIHNFLSMY